MLAGYGHLLRAADRLRWDESELDLSADAAAWPKLPKYARVPLSRLLAGFCVAEAAVAEHLEPFEASSDDPELRACFAAQAEDERRHARFFARVATEVLGIDPDREARELAGDGVMELFEQTLPARARDLAEGRCDLAQAVTLYHLVLEGVVFSVGQAAALELLAQAGTLPATHRGLAHVQADERWHVGLGVRCLQDTAVNQHDLEATLKMATAAAKSWQTDAIGPERVAAVVEQHRRRLAQARPSPSAVQGRVRVGQGVAVGG